ncbi:hypothetical protein UB31_11490 [Bradyrhizobium sp. LTSP849]|uniref:hypothetical protein n=1 Tax=Bradyrhizobium sp. LTSP849 TaxID=1615890 RepID=UPI0005D1863E|nr:hypothetical protein [Bradyrhizobium sp. LTSP849]KJC51540.1 hypothetical protein UB31_11490 [Bradyrhizobium sp. LTSP849]
MTHRLACRIRHQKRICEINDRSTPFDPGSAAKCRLYRRIARRAAAVRRHAVCSVGVQGNITNQINYIIEHDAIVTWLDLIMSDQYGPRGF